MMGKAVTLVAACGLAGCGSFPESLIRSDGASDVLATCAAQGTICGSRCKDPATALVRKCSASGACNAIEEEQSCGAFRCDVGKGACLTTCASDSDCAAGAYLCSTGWCLPRGGEPCSEGKTCASGFCADGVCCDRACKGTCEACDLSGNAGLCKPIAAGEDRDNECAEAKPCGTDGACDGKGACRLFPTGIPCPGPSQCKGGSTILAWQCDGQGSCAQGEKDCFPYQCDAASSACFSSCGSSTEKERCASNMKCDTSSSTCRSSCASYGDCQGYWNCDLSKGRCFTYCSSKQECRPTSSDYYCDTGSHECKYSS